VLALVAGLIIASPPAGLAVGAVWSDIARSEVAAAEVAIIARALGDTSALNAFSLFESVERLVRYYPRLRPLPRTEMFETSGLGGRLDECRSDARCIGARLMAAGVGFALEVTADVGADGTLLSARWIDDHGRAVAEAVDEGTALSTLLARVVPTLLADGGQHPAGRVEVVIEPVGAVEDATISVGGTSPLATAAPNVFLVAPGVHTVRVEHDDHVTATAPVQVAALKSARVELTLEVASAPWYESVWFWVATSVVVAAGASTTAVLLSREPESFTVCRASTMGACPGP